MQAGVSDGEGRGWVEGIEMGEWLVEGVCTYIHTLRDVITGSSLLFRVWCNDFVESYLRSCRKLSASGGFDNCGGGLCASPSGCHMLVNEDIFNHALFKRVYARR